MSFSPPPVILSEAKNLSDARRQSAVGKCHNAGLTPKALSNRRLSPRSPATARRRGGCLSYGGGGRRQSG